MLNAIENDFKVVKYMNGTTGYGFHFAEEKYMDQLLAYFKQEMVTNSSICSFVQWCNSAIDV